MRKLFVATVVVLLMFPASMNLAQPGRQPSRPNIIFILIDDLRWDELGITGHPFVKTPHIDRIGREGALFRNAFMTTPLCSPSRASFLTGQYAQDRKSTRLNSSHGYISYAVFCLKKKKINHYK